MMVRKGWARLEQKCAMLSGGQVQFTLDVQGLDMSAGSSLDAHEQKPMSVRLLLNKPKLNTRNEA